MHFTVCCVSYTAVNLNSHRGDLPSTASINPLDTRGSRAAGCGLASADRPASLAGRSLLGHQTEVQREPGSLWPLSPREAHRRVFAHPFQALLAARELGPDSAGWTQCPRDTSMWPGQAFHGSAVIEVSTSPGFFLWS